MNIPYPDGHGGWTTVGPTRAPPIDTPTALPVGGVVTPPATTSSGSSDSGGFLLIGLAAVGLFLATLSIKPGPVAVARTQNPTRRSLQPVYAFYDGKVVDMSYIPDPKRRFSFAGMRCLDNARSGYIIDGSKVYSVSREYRMAKIVTGDAAEAVLADVAATLAVAKAGALS